MARIAPKLREGRIKVLANAGGLNPLACAREVRRLAPDLKVAVVLGDDVYRTDWRVPRERLSDDEHGHRRAAPFHPRAHLERERLPGGVSARGSAANGRRRGAVRKVRGRRSGARPGHLQLWLAARQTTTCWRPAWWLGTSSSAARRSPAETRWRIGRVSPTCRGDRLPHRRDRAGWKLRGHQASWVGRARGFPLGQRAVAL